MLTNLPNILTFFRIFLIPVIIAILFLDSPLSNWLSFSIFLIASATDFLDGWAARTFNSSSQFGKFLDPIADKLLVTSILIVLIYLESINGVFVFFVLIILLREIFISGLREFLSFLGQKLPVSNLAKWKTATQFCSICLLLIGDALEKFPLSDVGLALLTVATFLTILSAYYYLKDTLKYLINKK